jgi:hypothetical protein
MKSSNAVVTVIIIAAVLVFAYGLGLLIRQARTSSSEGQKRAEVDKAAAAQHAAPRVARTNDTVEQRIQIKEQKAQARADMNNPTPEKIKEFQEQTVKRMGGGRRGSRGSRARPAPPAEVQATGTPSPAPAGTAKTDANTPAAPGGSTTTKPSTDQKEKTGAEPGKAGPGQ